ncbi:unnamed protein product [Clonostachys chloroleuca]|uniref:PX domain-containing protein n=1 Tax=Clonostachys chloroleuca TaxID=1926264 RepID=A0AA35LPP1_9HYPO|nr:unnamed protein product [Clonostachys chloroleuca]
MPASATLTSEQRHALFDILSHSETYSEIENFKYPDGVTGYGFPFSSETVIPPPPGRSASTTPAGSGRNTPRSRSRTPVPPGEEKKSTEAGAGTNGEVDGEKDRPPSTSPVLQTLFTRFALRLPWLRELPRDFWSVKIQGILSKLAEAELSESYDKGALGLRKTLATGSSSLLEMLGRGALGGLKKRTFASNGESKKKEYDLQKAEDLERAFDEIVHGLVYGDLVKKIVATFLHQIFVLSPEGQYLLQLIQNLHNLVPYKMVKQTLRISNVATMINGMTRLMLAKVSIGGITNYFGLTTNADDGMNLFQRIISLILSWDAAEFRKTAEKVEKSKAKDRPDEDMLKSIRQFIDEKSRMQHEAARAISMHKRQSIITTILTENDTDLTEEQHAQCLEYYSALLSIHDRDGITAALCRQQPDLFSQVVRDVVHIYEPFISMVHTGVDLKEYLDGVQIFIDEFIKASKPKTDANGEVRPASVEDYVELLRKNRGFLYTWIHDVASKCPGVWSELEAWAVDSFARFQQKPAQQPSEGEKLDDEKEKDKSDMDARLESLFRSLPESTQKEVQTALDAQASYLANLTEISRESFQHLLDSTADSESEKNSQTGPGNYLHRWHALLDETDITPENVVGPVRKGKDVKHTLALGKTSIIGNKQEVPPLPKKAAGPAAPDVSVVVSEMGPGFLKILQEIGGPGR